MASDMFVADFKECDDSDINEIEGLVVLASSRPPKHTGRLDRRTIYQSCVPEYREGWGLVKVSKIVMSGRQFCKDRLQQITATIEKTKAGTVAKTARSYCNKTVLEITHPKRIVAH
jgi:hypothetical protein